MSSKSGSSSSSTASRKKTPKSRKCSRKTRARARKPKYLSLKLELFPSQQQLQKKKAKSKTPQKPTMQETTDQQQQQQQLNLFPLHPENMVLDLNDDHQQVAFLLETATDSSTSLQSLLGISSNTASTTTTSATAATSEDDPLSLYRRQQDRSEEVECGGGPSLLVRTAMRCKERDASEERWVSYCEVVKKEPEEVSSDHNLHTNPAAAPDEEEQGMKMGLCKVLVVNRRRSPYRSTPSS